MDNLEKKIKNIESNIEILSNKMAEIHKEMDSLREERKILDNELRFREMSKLSDKECISFLFKNYTPSIYFEGETIIFAFINCKYYHVKRARNIIINKIQIHSIDEYTIKIYCYLGLRDFIRDFEIDVKQSKILDFCKAQLELMSKKKKIIDELYLEFE